MPHLSRSLRKVGSTAACSTGFRCCCRRPQQESDISWQSDSAQVPYFGRQSRKSKGRIYEVKLIAAVFALLLAATSITAKAEDSLYKRLGGYDAIAAVSDDFIGRLATDPLIKRFFVGHNTDSLKQLRQHIVDFLCQATGAPCAYHGRDMKTAHTGLGITEDD
jgi:hypothetical protein